ncbi:MAG: TRAP transporter substrate-binding protein [Treponema sp.]|nr:TRAP transporter substrate-binding protein [Treponema sp.]
MNKQKSLGISLILWTAILMSFSCSKKNETKPKSIIPKSEGVSSIVEYEIKFGFSTNMKDARAEAALFFKDYVERETDGRIKVSLYPDGQLGSDADLIKSIVNNEIDMVVSSAGNYATYVIPAGYSAMPFLFSTFEEAWNFIDSEANQEINKAFEDYNMLVLSYFDNGFRCLTTSENVGPIKCVADMDGLVVRTAKNQIVMETLYALNAIPKTYPFAELKEALKNGLFLAQENPIPVIYNNQLYEVQSYLAITNHSYDAMPVTIRKTLWDNLSSQDQYILRTGAELAQSLNRNLVEKQTTDYISKLKNLGMTITYPDLTEFKNATSVVFDVFKPVYGNLY